MLISMLDTIAMNILVSSTTRGFVPALLRTNVAIRLATLYFERAAAIVKPPSRSMITEVHIALNTNEAVSLVSRRFCEEPGSRTTRSTTTRNGTNKDVTNSGFASKANHQQNI